MMNNVDFYNTLDLPKPILCGLVHKITSPKGIRSYDESMKKYVYHLHQDLCQIWPNKPVLPIEPGLYWVMDLFRYTDKIRTQMQWNHYIVVLDENFDMYVVAEFTNCHDSEWIKGAIPVIKKYFNKETLEPVEITSYKKLKHKKQQ